ncbi:MAG: hypothetical protein II754_01660 [Lachnospiraceae bacterium]|nr:hypothetical protein [Lachnospiraceae bacterium]
MDTRDMLTVVDKIKISMAKGGADVGEISVSDEVIRDVGGEAALSAIQKAYDQADLPLTEENRRDTVKALELSRELTDFSDGAVKYMMQKDLEPTIENLYIAKASGQADTNPPLEAGEGTPLMDQIREVIEESTLPVEEKTVEESRWMIANDVPLTPESLEKVHELHEMVLPPEPAEVLDSVVEAVRTGDRPQNADFLALRRGREESRLVMSYEARETMEKLGVDTDLSELQKTVESLRREEKDYFESYLKQAKAPVTDENIALFHETERKLSELKEMPAYALAIMPTDKDSKEIPAHGLALPPADKDSLEHLHETAQPLKTRLDQAGEAYETMRTEIRKDLGDSIRKAFRNVDERLKDLHMPVTPENERAVRILSYNQIDLNEENLMAVKARDTEVNRAFSNLTPRVVAEFIKNGENPLDLNMTELNRRAVEIGRAVGIPEEEKYSEFLVKLEANKGITPEERESYIGIYRMLRQIEETDGAAVGALVAEGAEVTMRSLMTAVRSGRRSLDYSVGDDFGGVNVKEKVRNATDQAETAFHKNMIYEAADAFSPESMKSAMERDERWQDKSPEEFYNLLKEADTMEEEEAYVTGQLKSFTDAAKAEEEVYRAIERFELPNSVETVEVLQYMMSNPNAAMRKLFGMKNPKLWNAEGEGDLEEAQKELLRRFGEAAETPEDMAKAQKNLADIAENAMKTMLGSEETRTSLDVRELRLMAGQFRLSAKAAEKQQYHIPIEVQGETGELTLKIVSGREEKGVVDIMFSLSSLGNVAAKLRAEGQTLTGYIAADHKETADAFREREEAFTRELLSSSGLSEVKLSVVNDTRLDLKRFGAETDRENDRLRGEQGSEVTTRALYRTAKSFLSLLNDF